MSKVDVAYIISDKVQRQEAINSRMLGHDEIDAFILGWSAWGDTFCAMFAPDRPLVTTRFRP